MEQIQIFDHDLGPKVLETVNAWLKENYGKIEIIERMVLGSGSMIRVVIFYRTKSEEGKR